MELNAKEKRSKEHGSTAGIPSWAVRLVGGCQNLVVFQGQLDEVRRADKPSDSIHNSHQIA